MYRTNGAGGNVYRMDLKMQVYGTYEVKIRLGGTFVEIG